MYTVPASSPTNCMNVTFWPHNVTLSWAEPALIDQNGAPVGYNLVCTSINGVSVSGLNATQKTTIAVFTVMDVMPFNDYICNLTFINIIGQGPPAVCTFSTAQDSKYN